MGKPDLFNNRVTNLITAVIHLTNVANGTKTHLRNVSFSNINSGLSCGRKSRTTCRAVFLKLDSLKVRGLQLPEFSSQDTVPGEVSPQDGYVLLLVLLSIFIGGTLVLLFGILIVCRRCCETDRRASDDPEKTNTTYLDDSQPAQGEDAESERFLSSGSATGRRVSFNEAALFEQSKKTQEKGRRYTLTEGDFHHLKNARLSHLPLPPSAALKIVTIHECEANENSVMMTPRLPPVKPSLAIFQVSPPSLKDMGVETGVGFTNFSNRSLPSCCSGSAAKAVKGAPMAPPQELPSAPAQGTVLHFLTRLRRHASLEGASPYFRIKKWKLETSQRASSLDTRGSPKRHQFQRQRAASESMDQDRDPHQTDIIQYIARTDDVVFRPVAGPFLPAPASPTLSLGRYFSVDKWEGGEGRMGAQRIRADRDASQLWSGKTKSEQKLRLGTRTSVAK
uniref:Voltage-dependent calcium channel beta subunit-associated regulatory protein n=1 Tax=Naja naja TaxID=35670 RepID=A0A8C6VCD0_NAJNA